MAKEFGSGFVNKNFVLFIQLWGVCAKCVEQSRIVACMRRVIQYQLLLVCGGFGGAPHVVAKRAAQSGAKLWRWHTRMYIATVVTVSGVRMSVCVSISVTRCPITLR